MVGPRVGQQFADSDLRHSCILSRQARLGSISRRTDVARHALLARRRRLTSTCHHRWPENGAFRVAQLTPMIRCLMHVALHECAVERVVVVCLAWPVGQHAKSSFGIITWHFSFRTKFACWPTSGGAGEPTSDSQICRPLLAA